MDQIWMAYKVVSRLRLKNPDSPPSSKEMSIDPVAYYDLNALNDPITNYWQTYLFAIYTQEHVYSPTQNDTSVIRASMVRHLQSVLGHPPLAADLERDFPSVELDKEVCRLLDEDLTRLCRVL